MRKNYNSPKTKHSSVVVESTFCGASAEVQNPNTNSGKILDQNINTDFSSDSFDASGWE